MSGTVDYRTICFQRHQELLISSASGKVFQHHSISVWTFGKSVVFRGYIFKHMLMNAKQNDRLLSPIDNFAHEPLKVVEQIIHKHLTSKNAKQIVNTNNCFFYNVFFEFFQCKVRQMIPPSTLQFTHSPCTFLSHTPMQLFCRTLWHHDR